MVVKRDGEETVPVGLFFAGGARAGYFQELRFLWPIMEKESGCKLKFL